MSINHAIFLKRLKSLKNGKRDAEFSRLVGVPGPTLKRYEAGSFPSIEIAARIASACGVSLDWLCGFAEETRAQIVDNADAQTVPERGIDPAVFRQVGRLVTRVYKDEGVKLPPDAVLDEQADAYNALLARAEDPTDADELMALLPWLEARLKKRLRAAAEAPGTGKQQA